VLRPDGTLAIHGEYTFGLTGSFDVVWAPERGVSVLVSPSPESDRLPELGEYVQVDELPEALTKVKPEIPMTTGKESLVEGTVLVQALVGKDGRVKDTKVIKSVPFLDDAAVAAVRKWVFKPASSGGKPVAVWVAVPISFSLR
jgi:protein TonB